MLHRLKSKFSALSRGGKIAVVAAALFVTGSVASAANGNQSATPAESVKPEAAIEQSPGFVAQKSETKTSTEVTDVPFEKTTVDDATLPAGTTKIRTAGVVGKKTLTYEVTTTDGLETGKKLVSETITTAPVTEVTARGTKVAPAPAPKPSASCNTNYSGCVPIASDVDCAGGSGNGPAYVSGPLQVLGSDVYDLDRDGDGLACE